ncbi:MAG: hypothetical protein FH748_07160 [Balneolaceae bacterium]|nr:hypothetical protein [Balneolaceae bacterium]
MHAGLGSAYALLDDHEKAKTHLREAVKLAKVHGDDQLPVYEEKLKSLK